MRTNEPWLRRQEALVCLPPKIRRGNPMTSSFFPDEARLADLCRRRRIRKLSLFGSMLKGSSRPDSDVDLLVEFELGAEPGLIGLAGIENELSAMLGNRKIDLRTPADLSAYFRDEVVRTARVQYAA